MTAKGF